MRWIQCGLRVMLCLVLVAMAAPSLAKTKEKSLQLAQTKGRVRVTLLGVSRGVAYRAVENGTKNAFGTKPYQYVQALFLVEQSGPAQGNNGVVTLHGPEGPLKFRGGAWGPCDYKFYKKMNKFAVAERAPDLQDDTVEAHVYKQQWEAGTQSLPRSVSISARFFGEDFRFDKIVLP